MAVTVNDLRSVVSDASTLTGWTGAGELTTSTFVEGGSSVAESLNIATGQIYFSATNNLTSNMVYVYTFNNAIQDSFDAADPPNGLYLSDGTNALSFKMAGGDRRVFNHLDGPTEWQCLVLDTGQISAMNAAGLVTVRGGTVGAFNAGAVTQIGADFTTQSKALGGGINVAVDIIRFGNNGIEIVGGTTGDRGSFLEIVVEDRATTALKAHGIIRELTTDVYGSQGPLNFGNATVDSWFDDEGVVLAFENRNIGIDKYFINVIGNVATSTNFFLSDSTITTAGPSVISDFSSANIDSLEIVGNSFSGLADATSVNSGQITFATDTLAQSHIVSGNTFSGCGRIFPGVVDFNNNTISNSNDPTGSLELSATNGTNMTNIDFVSGGTGHAIVIPNGATGTYDFDGFTFTGFGASATTDAALYNNSGGAVTINVLSGDVPTVLNGAGSSTTIVAQATLSITNIVAGSELRIYSTLNETELDGIETVSGGLTSPRINAVGSGYTVGDLLTLSGGVLSGGGSAAIVEVTSVGGSGEITGVIVNSAGSYFDQPTSPISATGGTGTGATFSGRFLGTFDYSYNAGAAEEITLVVFHLRFNPFRINFDLTGNDQSILVQQIGDRVSQVSVPDTF